MDSFGNKSGPRMLGERRELTGAGLGDCPWSARLVIAQQDSLQPRALPPCALLMLLPPEIHLGLQMYFSLQTTAPTWWSSTGLILQCIYRGCGGMAKGSVDCKACLGIWAAGRWG